MIQIIHPYVGSNKAISLLIFLNIFIQRKAKNIFFKLLLLFGGSKDFEFVLGQAKQNLNIKN